MNEDVISFGERANREWKYITIDFKYGIPILLNGKDVGGFLIAPCTRDNLEMLLMHGIEVDPEHRGKGIGSAVVKMLTDQCDGLMGSITEDEPKAFWLSMGAEFRPIPLKSFGRLLDTVHTEEPMFFFITKNKEARKWAEFFASEVPKLMEKANF